GGHRGAHPGPLRRGREQFSLTAERRDVAGDVVVAVRGCGHAGKDATAARFPRAAGNATMEGNGHSGHRFPQRCSPAEGLRVTPHPPPLPVDHIALSPPVLGGWPRAARRAAFALLPPRHHPPFYAEPEFIFEAGPGYYALVRHADVVEASRNPDVFSSGKGATSIPDLPVEFNEYFGSMINMDDPRHARLRRIVSRAFTPRMIQRF